MEIMREDEWVAAYYPLETINNKRSRVIMGLLFDKIICHFPISGMLCGGGLGISNDVLESDLLFEEGILEPIEDSNLIFDGIDFSPGHYWGTDEEFEMFIRLNVTNMTMELCSKSNAVPVTDNQSTPLPASVISKMDLFRSANLHATTLAMQCLDFSLPSIAEVDDETIIKAREELRDQLIPFRRAMMTISPIIRSGLDSGATIEDIHSEAKYVVATKISPLLGELKDRLAKEKGTFWKKLILTSSAIIPKFALNWTTKSAISAAVVAINDAKGITENVIDYNRLMTSTESRGGFGYLLSISEHPAFK
jgi:hypothetical protein